MGDWDDAVKSNPNKGTTAVADAPTSTGSDPWGDAVKTNKSAGSTPPDTHWYSGMGDTLAREGKAAASALNPVAAVKGVYHAATDPVSQDEKAQFGDNAYKNAGPAGKLLGRMAVAPVMTAGKYYKDALQGKHGDASNVESQMLDVAPEAMGQAGGTVVGGKMIDSALKIAKGGKPMSGPMEEGVERPVDQTRGQIAKQEIGSSTIDAAKAAPGAIKNAGVNTFRGVGRTLERPTVARVIPPLVAGATGAVFGGAAPAVEAAGAMGAAEMGLPGIAKGVKIIGKKMAQAGMDVNEKSIDNLSRRVDYANKDFSKAVKTVQSYAGGEKVSSDPNMSHVQPPNVPDAVWKIYKKAQSEASRSINDLKVAKNPQPAAPPPSAAPPVTPSTPPATGAPAGTPPPPVTPPAPAGAEAQVPPQTMAPPATMVTPEPPMTRRSSADIVNGKSNDAVEQLNNMKTEPVNQPNVKMRDQNTAPKAAAEAPEKATGAAFRSGIKSHEFKPDANEFHVTATNGITHVYDATPEQAAKLGPQSTFNEIKTALGEQTAKIQPDGTRTEMGGPNLKSAAPKPSIKPVNTSKMSDAEFEKYVKDHPVSGAHEQWSDLRSNPKIEARAARAFTPMTNSSPVEMPSEAQGTDVNESARAFTTARAPYTQLPKVTVGGNEGGARMVDEGAAKDYLKEQQERVANEDRANFLKRITYPPNYKGPPLRAR
jgi:hypothetical protein